MTDREVIFFCPGPEYLFWGMGVYYLWELSQLYRVVLILDFPFTQLQGLERLKQSGVLYDFVPLPSFPKRLPSVGRAYLKHKHFSTTSKTVFARYQPRAILQHTDLEPSNIYLFEDASLNAAVRIRYMPSMVLTDAYSNYSLMRSMIVDRISQDWHIPYWLALAYFGSKKAGSFWVNYSLLPFLFRRSEFRPRIRAVARKNKPFYKENTRGYFDYNLTHSEKERLILLGDGEASLVIKNPLNHIGDEANRYLYGVVEQREDILLLPAGGEIDYIKHARAMSDEDVIQYVAANWLRAIDIIHKQFPTYKLFLKLRPGQDDVLFPRAVQLMVEKNDGITVIPPEENAQKLILGAKVVVSTFSTTLWWASFLRSKRILISLDLFNVPCGDWFADGFGGVCYFDSLESLESFDLCRIAFQGEDIASGPTLTEFIQTHVG